MKKLFLILLLTGCAYVHHVQVSEIDSRPNSVLVPFDIKISETGVNLGEAISIANSLTNDQKTSDQLQTLKDIIALFQMGPKTGNTVYNDTYTDNLVYLIYEKCPSGEVTGLISVRETAKYPVVSGEIVRLQGFCIHEKTEKKGKA